MIPIRLSITNFLSYHQTVELDFAAIHLACISGNNGAGKSTIIDAMTWALFGKARRTDDALIHGNENECVVIFDFGYENDVYRITRKRARGKTGEIDLFMYIPETGNWLSYSEKSLRETEARIQRILRMDFETFSNASFFLQGKADQFAQQKPGDRKRILSSILGLDIWEEYKERAATQRKLCESKVILIESRMEDIRLELGEETQRKDHLESAERELKSASEQKKQQEILLLTLRQVENSIKEQQKLIETLTTQLALQQNKQKETQTRLELRIHEKMDYQSVIDRAGVINQAYSHLLSIRKQLEEQNLLANKSHELEKMLVEPAMALAKEKTTLEITSSQLTKQEKSIQAILPEAQSKRKQADLLLDQLESLEKSVAGKSELETKRNLLNEQISDLRSENNRLNIEMQEIKERRDHLAEVHAANCPLCGQDLSEPHRSEVLGDLLNQGTKSGDLYRANQQKIQKLEAEIREIQLGLQEIQVKEKEIAESHRRADQLLAWLDQNEKLIKEWDEQGKQKLEQTTSSLQSDNYCQPERETIAEIQNQLTTLGYDPILHTTIQQGELSLRESDTDHQRLTQAAAILKQLDREIEDLGKETDRARIEIDTQTKLLQSAQDAYQQLASQFVDPRTVENTVNDLANQVNRLQQEVGAARQRVTVLSTLKAKMDELAQERETHSQQVGRYKAIEKAFGKDGVPALLIEQALPEIEIEANDILEKLSGGLMRINFLTQRDFKDKNRDDKKETLDIQISDMNGTRDYEMYSGGEAFRINFAIRLAMSKVLAKRAGARLQTLVIDEGFGSQDASGRQRLIEAIRLVQNDFAKVLVITHLEELKDAFPHRIEVEKSPSGSSVRVIT
jgi:DNA repair protein SbcC/Rad50